MDDEVLANLSEIIFSLDPNHCLPYETLKYVFENKERLAHFTEDSVKHFPEILALMKVGENDLCNEAARIGSLPLLKIARESGCEWDDLVCSSAAINGHLDCLVYACENGCPQDAHIIWDTRKCGEMECLRYLQNRINHDIW
jgi:hypothetical protein